jgi:hypothetical protein
VLDEPVDPASLNACRVALLHRDEAFLTPGQVDKRLGDRAEWTHAWIRSPQDLVSAASRSQLCTTLPAVALWSGSTR